MLSSVSYVSGAMSSPTCYYCGQLTPSCYGQYRFTLYNGCWSKWLPIEDKTAMKLRQHMTRWVNNPLPGQLREWRYVSPPAV